MNQKEMTMRRELQDLADKKPHSEADLRRVIQLKKELISKFGWARGKKLPDGSYSMLEQ